MRNLIASICGIQLLSLISYTESKCQLNILSKCKADAKEPWSYRGNNGPTFWGETFPACNGQEQSPIALDRHSAVLDENLPKLDLRNYDIPVSKATIQNNGHTIQVTPTDDVERTILVNGATYSLIQLHFHWGDAYYHGSEHTLDGMAYAMEMHLVHQNDNNQLAVVGVFFQEYTQTSSEMETIIREFPKVMYKDTITELKSPLKLNNLLPVNPSSFYRYSGSLTTPGCAEGVTWSVLPKPLPIGLVQMAQFRRLYSATKSEASPTCRLSNNYRPIQEVNNRTVFISQ